MVSGVQLVVHHQQISTIQVEPRRFTAMLALSGPFFAPLILIQLILIQLNSKFVESFFKFKEVADDRFFCKSYFNLELRFCHDVGDKELLLITYMM